MKRDWVQVPGAPQTYKMETSWGTFTVQPSRGYPRSRTFVVKRDREVIESFVRDGIQARIIAEEELNRLEQQEPQMPSPNTLRHIPRARR